MPKIGTLEYPTITLTDAISVTERIAKDFHGSVTTSGLAKALGMAEKGGGFLHKVAAVKNYGLIEGRGTLKVTPLGERIVFPQGIDGDRARAEAFSQIDLFARLFQRTQGRVPDEASFEIFLQEVSAASRMEVATKANAVRRLFADGAQYATANLEGDAETDEVTEQPTRRPVAQNSATMIELIAGDTEIRLPASPQSIDLIIAALNMMKTQLASEKSTDQG